MKPIKIINDPEAFQLLADETRRKTIFLLRAKEMTVSQIAADLNITPQAVYHHIKKLLKAEMVEVSKEVRVDHLIESYYRATAEVFNCTIGQTSGAGKVAKDQLTTVLNALKEIGFDIETNENSTTRLMEIITELDSCCLAGKFEEQVSKLNNVDVISKQIVSEYAEILAMPDEDFAKQQELRKKLRGALISLVKK
jgi:DNA-binding transcriptional ArsR family regulator